MRICALLKVSLAVIIPLLLSGTAYPGQITISNQYPSPAGIYTKLRLVPQPLLSGPCDIGTFYVDNVSNIIQYCEDGTGYEPISSPWEKEGNFVHLVDNLNLVGIGTDTPEFKLSLQQDGGILARGTFNSGKVLSDLSPDARLIWYPRKAAIRAGQITPSSSLSGEEWHDSNIGSFSVGFGLNSLSRGAGSVVGGGANNIADGTIWFMSLPLYGYSTVAGGYSNEASGPISFVGGGSNNKIPPNKGLMAFIGGGGGFVATDGNIAEGDKSAIVGGMKNQATHWASTVGGGSTNIAGQNAAVVAGGNDNQAMCQHCVVSGGNLNRATGLQASVIGGGYNNQSSGNTDFIGGGANNESTGQTSVVVGGNTNKSFGTASFVGAGNDNTANNARSAIVGGGQNETNADGAFVGGGFTNKGDGANSAVAGGNTNTASGANAFVGAGTLNVASGNNSTVPGGAGNVAASPLSFAAGQNMVLGPTANNTFIWGHSGSAIPAVNTPNAFIIYTGNVGIGMTNPSQKLHVAGAVKLEPLDTAPVCNVGAMGAMYVYQDGGLCFCGSLGWERINNSGTCP